MCLPRMLMIQTHLIHNFTTASRAKSPTIAAKLSLPSTQTLGKFPPQRKVRQPSKPLLKKVRVILLLCNYLCVVGAALLRARTGVMYSRGETRGNVDVLKRKFDEFCSARNEMPFENNPFFTCVQHAGVTHIQTHTIHTI